MLIESRWYFFPLVISYRTCGIKLCSCKVQSFSSGAGASYCSLAHELTFLGQWAEGEKASKEGSTSLCSRLVSTDLRQVDPVGLWVRTKSELSKPEERELVTSGKIQNSSVRANEDTLSTPQRKAQLSSCCCFCVWKFESNQVARILT